jgi:maltose alpha-D-glucosyltransferase/alpha-amylase
VLSEAGVDPALVACIMRVELRGGEPEAYFIPVALSTNPLEATRFAHTGRVSVYDAAGVEAFRQRWLELLLGGSTVHGNSGRLEFHSSANLQQLFPELPGVVSARRNRLSKAEQSNSALIYSDSDKTDRFILKLFRRVAVGINPDLEVTGYLTEKTSFRNVPLLAGGVEYVSAADERMSVAVLQRFVANRGDGWEATVSAVRELLSSGAPVSSGQHDIELLGRHTAELHNALATATDNRDFRPEPITAADAAAWTHSLQQSARAASSDLRARLSEVAGEHKELARQIADRLSSSSVIDSVAEGFLALTIGVYKIRVHGDYHLGQVLKTEDDFVIFDFEGEPARPLSLRRQKTSVLKDVSGMLRSFDYAAHTAAAGSSSRLVAARRWEQNARQLVWDAYKQTIKTAPVRLIPQDAATAEAALTAWEFDKAVYELSYEMHNRPTWIAIPLHGLARLLKLA